MQCCSRQVSVLGEPTAGIDYGVLQRTWGVVEFDTRPVVTNHTVITQGIY